MNWQEKYYEIALEAVMKGRDIQRQFQNNGNPTPTIYDKVTRNEAKRIAEKLDRLHDMEVPYNKGKVIEPDLNDQPF